nr:putative ribonuclease H-like domain-containing protein [Tanacetum cinerariifolium]
NQTLHAYFATEGIHHQTSVARTPKQNGIVERRNRTLVEAARTMLSAANVPLFFWAEAIATASAHDSSDPALTRQQMASVQNSTDPGPTCQSMASVQISSDPAPECQTMELEHNSLCPGRNCQENVSHGDKTEHPSDLKVFTMKMEILLEPTLNKLLVGDSLNFPDHRYNIYTVKRYIADVAASFQRSQIHKIKLSMQHKFLSDRIETRQPERLPLTRKVVSLNTQEKLCQAMKSTKLPNDKYLFNTLPMLQPRSNEVKFILSSFQSQNQDDS